MRISFTFGADIRATHGKGASRRLRHAGKVPAILYGAHKDAQSLVLDQQNLLTMIADERFYSSIVRLKIGEATQEAIVKDVQMHPARNVVVHVDLQRVALATIARELGGIDPRLGRKLVLDLRPDGRCLASCEASRGYPRSNRVG